MEQAAFHDDAIKRLHSQYEKLKNRLDQIYLDKLDGEIEDAFYKRSTKAWRAEQEKIEDGIRRHRKADENYVEQGIKLLELAENSASIYRTKGQKARAELIRFIMPDSMLEKDTVRPVFKPPFDIIHRLAAQARSIDTAVEGRRGAALTESECLLLLPGVDSNF